MKFAPKLNPAQRITISQSVKQIGENPKSCPMKLKIEETMANPTAAVIC
jgi:hypothetical protein